jgi:hypothetical protein
MNHEVQQLYNVSDRLDSLAEQHPLEHRVSGIPLRENCLLLGKEHDLPTLTDGGEKLLRVEVPYFRSQFCWWAQKLPPNCADTLR